MRAARSLLIAAILLLSAPHLQAGVFHVAPWGSDASSGLAWNQARRTLQAATALTGSGDQIWAAAGTYTGPLSIPTGVAIYGGFQGIETSLDQRDPAVHASVISAPGAAAVSFNMPASGLTRLDGFTVKAPAGAGIVCGDGGGVIANCVIQGGVTGVKCQFGYPLIVSCTITGGLEGVTCSMGAGPAVFATAITGTQGPAVSCSEGSVPLIERCKFTFCAEGIVSTDSSPTVRSTAVADVDGDGLRSDAGSVPTISNSTIVRCFGAGIALQGGGRINASIIAFNGTGVALLPPPEPPDPPLESPIIGNNCVWGNPSGDYAGMQAPADDLRGDPLLGGFGGFHLQPGSPCIDAAFSAEVQPGWLDVDGEDRLQGAAVDIGADEAAAGIPSVRIGEARKLPIGAAVDIQGVVSAAFTGFFYLQQADRSAGVRIEWNGTAPPTNSMARVQGLLVQTPAGERALQASSVTAVGTSEAVRPLTVRCGVEEGGGLKVGGLLVEVSGRVVQQEPGGGAFLLDDGSAVSNERGQRGIRVELQGRPMPGVGSHVRVKGLFSRRLAGQVSYPMFMMISPAVRLD